MPPIETPATVLSTIAYGETSKVARLATRELGVVSVIAKGARRPRSRFGAALQVLSEGVATILPSRHSDLHTLTGFELTRLHADLAGNVERFAVASVLGELMLRFTSADRQAATYDFFRHSLDVIEAIPPESVAELGLRTIWGLVKHLGFAPALGVCAIDGAPVSRDDGAIPFSARHGGVVCRLCAAGIESRRLTPRDLADLEVLIHGHDDLPGLDDRYLAAHRRLLDDYIRHHLGEGSPLPALSFWAEASWKGAR